MESYWFIYLILHAATTSSGQVISRIFCKESTLSCADRRIHCTSQYISIDSVYFEDESNCSAFKEFKSQARCCCGHSISGNISQDQAIKDIISNACNNKRSCDIGDFFLQHSGRITIQYECHGGSTTVPTRTNVRTDVSVSTSSQSSGIITSSQPTNASHVGNKDDINATFPILLTLLATCILGAGVAWVTIKRRRLQRLKQDHEYVDVSNVSRDTDIPTTVGNPIYIHRGPSADATSVYYNTTQPAQCNEAESSFTKHGDTNMYDTIVEPEYHESNEEGSRTESAHIIKRNSTSNEAGNYETDSLAVLNGIANRVVDGPAPAVYDTVDNIAVKRHCDDDKKASTYNSLTIILGASGTVNEAYDTVTRFARTSEPLNETYDHIGRGFKSDRDVYDHANLARDGVKHDP